MSSAVPGRSCGQARPSAWPLQPAVLFAYRNLYALNRRLGLVPTSTDSDGLLSRMCEHQTGGVADDRPRLVTALAAALKAARESKGWTQRRLAAEVTSAGHNFSSAYVGLIEAGHRIPTDTVVRALADVLDRDADELIRLRSEAAGRRWVEDFLARYGDRSVEELGQLAATPASVELRDTSISVAAGGGSAWLSRGGGPRRGRRYELATRLFELVADLNADEIQRVIGYVEAVRENRRSH